MLFNKENRVKIAYCLLFSSRNRVKALARRNDGTFKIAETRYLKAVEDKLLHNDRLS
jgi:hypothetical protein